MCHFKRNIISPSSNAGPSEHFVLNQYLFRFDAGPGKRVELTIFIINVRGAPDICPPQIFVPQFCQSL